MDQEIYNALLNADDVTLCRWGNTLNHWKWPKDLPGKPKGFDQRLNYAFDSGRPDKHQAIKLIIKMTKLIAGEKAFLHWHWCHVRRNKKNQFEKWWRKDYHGLR